MTSKLKVVVGSLIGAIAIHAAFVACGGNSKPGADNTDGGPIDAMLDVISDVVGGETRDAVAGVDAGGATDGGACGCTVSLSGPLQNTPASENSAQLTTGSITSISGAAGHIVITGPFVLTDAMSDQYNGSDGASLAIQSTASSCTALSAPSIPDLLPGYLLTITTTTSVHGGRFVVPAGQMLCAYTPVQSGTGSLQWAGFVPYQ